MWQNNNTSLVTHKKSNSNAEKLLKHKKLVKFLWITKQGLHEGNILTTLASTAEKYPKLFVALSWNYRSNKNFKKSHIRVRNFSQPSVQYKVLILAPKEPPLTNTHRREGMYVTMHRVFFLLVYLVAVHSKISTSIDNVDNLIRNYGKNSNIKALDT